jgi:CubicO group peptidase (beta-lactamase class C family)
VSDYTLPASGPSAQGVVAEGVQALLDALEGTPGVEPHSLMVLRHGYVVVAGWWAPYTPLRPQLLYSLSKSFTSTAAGLAVGQGLVDLDRPVLSYFPELDSEVTAPRSRSMLVRHIASMASGHLEDTWQRVVAAGGVEPVRAFLLLPPERDPGTVFAYNQSATYTLAAIVQRVTGESLSSYLSKGLPGPFASSELRWDRDQGGREIGLSGLHASTETVARLGLLYLNGGAWEGEQLLGARWVAEATRAQISTAGPNMAGRDWEEGYGFQFWRSRHGYRGDGAYGQFCLVLPDDDAVVAITSQAQDMQAVLDAVWDNLLPAFLEGPLTDTAPDARLRERLAELAVPAPHAQPLPPAGGQQVWLEPAFSPAGGRCDQQPSLSEVSLTTDQGGWRVTLAEPGWHLSARMGTQGWLVTEGPQDELGAGLEVGFGGDEVVPVACMGGWLDATSLSFDLIFLETPHRLRVTCKIPEQTFEATWATLPLHAPSLQDLRAPTN